MHKNPYLVLGVKEDATDYEIDSAYQALRTQYYNDQFQEGAAGNRAARNLSELEAAYAEIKELRTEHISQDTQSTSQSTSQSSVNLDYDGISKLIQQNRLDEAQKQLDAVTEHTGDWHYLQSIIFYKKNWFFESKKQLELALQLEPNNPKFKESYRRLEAMTGSAYNGDAGKTVYMGPARRNSICGNTPEDCCCNLLLADCCCECMGGDLITCC